MRIVKSFSLKSTYGSLEKESVDADDVKGIVNATIQPVFKKERPNEFTTLIPLQDNAKRRSKEYLDFSGCIQPIVLEFDHDDLENQKKRAEVLTDELGIDSYLIYSGNKSLHHLIWCEHFADSADEYREKGFKFLYYLSEEFSKWYSYPSNKDNQETDPNLPDTEMFKAYMYFRQPDGYRPETGKEQKCIKLHGDNKFLVLEDYIANITLPKKKTGQKRKRTKKNEDANKGRVKSDGLEPITFKRLIADRLSLKKYLEEDLEQEIDLNGGKTVKINPCPICGHNDCFTYYPETDTYYCFSDDHKSGGSIIKYFMERFNLKGKDFKTAVYNLAKRCLPKLYQESARTVVDFVRRTTDMYKRDRNEIMTKIIYNDLKEKGRFLKSNTGEYFYKVNNSPRIFKISEDNDKTSRFDAHLSDQYGLNASDTEYKYIMNFLLERFVSIEDTVQIHRYVYYNESEYTLYLQCSRDYVYKITKSSVTRITNGTDDVIFDPTFAPEEFEYLMEHDAGFSTWRDLFINMINFTEDEDVPLNPAQSRYLLERYIKYIPFAYSMPTKPLISFVGRKGSGKTMALRIMFSVLFGPKKFNVVGMHSKLEKDWQTLSSQNIFLVIDNCDDKRHNSWFPDALAAAATGQKMQAREYYTTNDLTEFEVNLLIGLTARTPAFKREDVNERLLLFKVDPIKRSERIAESKILKRIYNQRDELMTELIHSIQVSLKRLEMNEDLEPEQNIRIADFSDFVFKTIPEDHRGRFGEIVDTINESQAAFTLEDNPLWINIREVLDNMPLPEEITTVRLYGRIMSNQGENSKFNRYYSKHNFAKNFKKILDEINMHSNYTIEWLGRGTGNKTYLFIKDDRQKAKRRGGFKSKGGLS